MTTIRNFRRSALIGIAMAFLALPSAQAAEHVVQVVSDYENLRMYFSPKTLTIAKGDTVTWVNNAKELHNIVSYPDGFPQGAVALASPDLVNKGQKWSYKFTKSGSYEYHCLPHLPMGMHGVVIVDRPSKDAEFHQPSKQEVAVYRNRLLEYFDEDEYQYKDRRKRQASR